MYCKDNTERSICIKRNLRGGLVENCSNYRVLNRSSGYERYVKDEGSGGHPLYSRSYFYKRNKELNLVDIKEDGDICPNFTIIGNEKWDKLRMEIQFLYSVTDENNN